VVLLVLLVMAPAAVVIYYSAADRRDDSANRVRLQTVQLANNAAVDYNRSVESSREFLLPLSQLIGLLVDLTKLKEADCAPTFTKLIQSNPRILSISAALPDGTVVCGNGPGSTTRANVADQPFFQDAIAHQDLAVSDLTTDAATGKRTIDVAYPILGGDGSTRGVLFAGLDLNVVSNTVGARELPEGSFITIRSGAGTILARFPDPERWVGQPVRGTASDSTPVPVPRTSEGVSLDGTPVLTASTAVPPLQSADGVVLSNLSGAIASVGIPKAVGYSGLDARLRNDLLALLAVTVVAAVGAWFGSGWILRQLRGYAAVTRRFASGDLTARAGPTYPKNEIGALGVAFDDMATAIEQRDREIRQLNEGLERRVLDRTAELEAANQELESFSYSVSHDLRAPLRSIDGFSRIILEEHQDEFSEDALGLFQRVRNSAQQMGNLVDDLLTFSRLGRRPVTRATVDMKTLFEETFATLSATSPERKIEFELGPLPTCEGDAGLLRHVVTNLLENALKFTRQREVAHIEVGCEQQDAGGVYYVRDNGAGFDMRYADKLFGVFQRLHRADQFEGTGVGLAIVQRIVHRHGGRAWAQSELNVGTTLYFTIGSGETDEE
jgi:signal transduction histidine kinase